MSFIGNEAKWRSNEDIVKKAMLILDPTQRAVDDGYVVGWHVYTTRGRRSQEVYLQIWRPLRSAENRSEAMKYYVARTEMHCKFRYRLLLHFGHGTIASYVMCK